MSVQGLGLSCGNTYCLTAAITLDSLPNPFVRSTCALLLEAQAEPALPLQTQILRLPQNPPRAPVSSIPLQALVLNHPGVHHTSINYEP